MSLFATFGTIKNPLQTVGSGYGDVTDLPQLISNIVRLITIGAGLFALINFVLAGVNYISAGGDEQKINQSWQMILNSIIGLLIIAMAFILTGIISYVLYKDTSVILKPTIYGPGSI